MDTWAKPAAQDELVIDAQVGRSWKGTLMCAGHLRHPQWTVCHARQEKGPVVKHADKSKQLL